MVMNNNGRHFLLNDQEISAGPIIWWLQRDQRLADNWTYVAASEQALRLKQPVIAVFCAKEMLIMERAAAEAGIVFGTSPVLYRGYSRKTKTDRNAEKILDQLTVSGSDSKEE